MTDKNDHDTYKCPDCGADLEPIIACGAESYFCNVCKSPISRKRILGHPHYVEVEKES